MVLDFASCPYINLYILVAKWIIYCQFKDFVKTLTRVSVPSGAEVEKEVNAGC